MQRDGYDVVIVGGGFFGITLALEARRYKRHVLLVEAERALMLRSSYRNQARIHRGYHYPRSLLTAERSRVNSAIFVETYSECVIDDFQKLYAIARHNSKVSTAQFRRFSERVGAPVRDASSAIQKLFDRRTVEGVYSVQEFAFDSAKLRASVERQLQRAEVEVLLEAEVVSVTSGDELRVDLVESDSVPSRIGAAWLFNATYSNLNHLLARSKLGRVPLKHELAELALVRPPPPLDRLGVTVMDGPFFSCMPFPPASAHSFTHVRYTPHETWLDSDSEAPKRWRLSDVAAPRRRSLFGHMLRDATRFLPMLAETQYLRSLWEVKTLLPQSERDDSRPILLHQDEREPRVVSALGAKIDNVIDMADRVRQLLA